MWPRMDGFSSSAEGTTTEPSSLSSPIGMRPLSSVGFFELQWGRCPLRELHIPSFIYPALEALARGIRPARAFLRRSVPFHLPARIELQHSAPSASRTLSGQ